jgi:hypothetical protein
MRAQAELRKINCITCRNVEKEIAAEAGRCMAWRTAIRANLSAGCDVVPGSTLYSHLISRDPASEPTVFFFFFFST